MKQPRLPKKMDAILAEIAEADPRMAHAIETTGAFTLEDRAANLHDLCVAIIGQQVSIHAARAIAGRFSARFGDATHFEPRAVLAAPVEELRACGLSRAKAETVPQLVRMWTDNGLSAESFDHLTDAQIHELFETVKGIGPWTVKMFLIFTLRRPDVLPHEDLGVRLGMKHLYRMRAEPKRPRIEQVARKWAPYRSVGTWYCWRWLHQVREAEKIEREEGRGKKGRLN